MKILWCGILHLQTHLDRVKLFVERLVEKVGFFGILACASVSIKYKVITGTKQVLYLVK